MMSLQSSPSKLSAEHLAVITDLEAQDRVVPGIHSPCSTSDQGRTSDQHVGKLSASAEDGNLSERALQKRRLKAQRNLANEFVSALGARIASLETTLASGTAAEKEAARARRKQLREVQKVAGDPALAVEDRLKALQGTLLQQAADAAKGDRSVLELRAQLDATTKERDRARAELQTSNVLRRKLEELCRGLQRENKEVAEAASRLSEDDKTVQQAMQAKLHSTLEDLQTKIKAQETTLLADNTTLRETLEKHVRQAALEAERNAQALNMKDLELQLAQTQLKQKELMQQEVEARCAAEVHMTLCKTAEERKVLMEANSALKEQLNMYSDKFKGFEKTLHDSNKMYSSWKTQLESQQKQMKQMLQERNAARNDRMCIEKAAAEEQRKLTAQVDALQKLCRALQAKMKSGSATAAGSDAALPDAPAAVGADSSGDQQADLGNGKGSPDEAGNAADDASLKAAVSCDDGMGDGHAPLAAVTVDTGSQEPISSTSDCSHATSDNALAPAAAGEVEEGALVMQHASTSQPPASGCAESSGGVGDVESSSDGGRQCTEQSP